MSVERDQRPTVTPLTPPPESIPVSSTAPIPVTHGLELTPVDAPAPSAPNLDANPVEGENTVTLVIDGQEIKARKGTNVLEAAKLINEDVPHFCYHQGLSIAASCRQCLVEVELRGRPMGKLQPACQMQVADEMVVQTKSPAVLKARRELLEFTLKNHPIDCPICDKAGECTLQRHYMNHDHGLTKVDVPKVHKPKVKDIGREIILDAERCILCSRCIRFCNEIPKTSELTMAYRGDHEMIDVAAGLRLDNDYSMNVVDICPVGALTAKDFRFKIRAWELRGTPSTCMGCATGCAIELQSKHEQAYRVVPRFDPTVNGHWMCDAGRFTYRSLDPEQRVTAARVDGEDVSLATAIEATATRLQGKKTAVVFSAVATNEANMALSALAELLEAERFVLGRAPGEGDDILRDVDQNPNTRGAHQAAGDVSKHEGELALELAGRAYEAVLFLDGEGALSDISVAALGQVTSVCLTDRRTAIADACSIVLPTASWAEIIGTTLNRQGRLRILQPAWRPEGERRHPAEIVRQLILALGGQDPGSPEALSRQLGNADLTQILERPNRPKLLRFANSRG